MLFFDTHTHLYLDAFDNDRAEVMQRALENGVAHFMLPNIDNESIGGMMNMVHDYPGVCFGMAGLHPTSVKEDYPEHLKGAENLLGEQGIIGIGECGLDLYWDKQHLEQQKVALKTQLTWSLERDLPVSIHIRDAFAEVFEVLKTFGDTKFRGVFHCFTGTTEEADKAISYGFMLGVGGVVTFKNSPLQQVFKQVRPEHVVLETDAPFLAPAPFRGKRNEPAYLPYVAGKLAELWNIPLNQVAEITTANACHIFKIQP